MSGIWTKESKEFANSQENRTDTYMSFLTGSTGWFSSFTGNARNSEIDYNYIDKNGYTGVIECKIRKCSFDRFDEMFIELNKFNALTGATLSYSKSTYINFLNDSNDEFLIFDIRKIMNNPLNIQRNVYIKNLNLPTENNYTADRYLLPKEWGRHFKLNKLTNEYEEIK